MRKKLLKQTSAAILLTSSLLSYSPIAHGNTTSIQQSIDEVRMEMKRAALHYVTPALEGNLVSSPSLYSVLNNVKKNYDEVRKLVLSSNLSEKEKQAKLKALDALYEEKIEKGLIPYIDAYNYATKYLEPLLQEIKVAEANKDFTAVEQAYHKLSVQLKSRTSILYGFTGKAPRDLLLKKYKKPADETRDELIIPVTIMMKIAEAQQLYQAGKIVEATKLLEDIPVLVAQLSNANVFHQASLKELERLQAIGFPTAPATSEREDNSSSSETSVQRALRLAKANANTELKNYKVDVKGNYSLASWSQIETLKTTGTNAINAAKTPAEVTQAKDTTIAAIDQIPLISTDSTVSGIKVNGIDAVVDNANSIIYNVTLPAKTDITKAIIVSTATDVNAKVDLAVSTNNGVTWQVVVTAEDGKSTTTYTINITVTPQ